MKTLRSVVDLAQKRNFAAAAALAEKTLADGFEHPVLLNVLATQLEHLGRDEDALRLLQRAITIAPNDLSARNALGLCLLRLGRPAEALVQIDALLDQHPELHFAHASRGNALIALGLWNQAEESHLRSVRLEPDNFVSLAGLASIAVQHSQYERARQWAQRALALAPSFPEAVLSLAATEAASGELASAESRLQQLIIDSRSEPVERARAAGLLGDVLDAGGRFAEAFEFYRTSNDSLAQIHKRLAGRGALAYTRALSAAISTVHAGQWQVRASASKSVAAGHVFLLGFPCAGTTRVEIALRQCSQAVCLNEHELLALGASQFMREPIDFQALADASEDAMAALQADYWQRVRAAGIEPAGKVFIDHNPLNTLKLPLIAKVFPNASIIFAVRDPRDVVFDCFRRRFPMSPSMYECLTLSGTADFYAETMQMAQSAKCALALDWHEIRWERLMAAFDAEMLAVCQYVGLDWAAGRGSLPVHRFDAAAAGHWRHYEAQLMPTLPALAACLQNFGYAG